MIINAIHNNKIGAYLILLLFVFSSWIGPLFINDLEQVVVNNPMPLWRIIQPFVNASAVLSKLLALAFALIVGISINRYVSKYSLLNKQTALPAFTFIFCIAVFPQAQFFTPSWIGSLFFLIALSLLFETHSQRRPASNCFLASFWMSIASMFLYEAFLVFPLLIVLMITMRVFNIKSFLAAIIGFSLPWLFYASYIQLSGEDWNLLWSAIVYSRDRLSTDTVLSVFDWVRFGYLLLLMALSYVSIASHYNKKNIAVRLLYKVLVVISLYVVVVSASAGYSFSNTPMVSVPIAIILAHLIDNIKSTRWQGVLFISMLIMLVLSQFYPY